MKKTPTLTSLILQQNFLTLLLLTLAVVGVWVGFSIYFSYSKTTIASTDATLIAPLNPQINSALFDTLMSRKQWSSQELSSFTPSVVAVKGATPLPSSNSTASSSALRH